MEVPRDGQGLRAAGMELGRRWREEESRDKEAEERPWPCGNGRVWGEGHNRQKSSKGAKWW